MARVKLPEHLLRESDVKAACVKKLRALGCLVGSVGNRHRSQLPAGWSDTTVILPRGLGVWFIEFKGPNGRTAKPRAEKQQAFRDACFDRGVKATLLTSVADLDEHLREYGLTP